MNMENKIHSTAVISKYASLGNGNVIGPYSIIDDNVNIGSNNIIKSHVVITGNTDIGDDNKFFSFACIGDEPQDKKYNGEDSKLLIGNDNVIREYVTINPGTKGGGMITKIGDNCLIMASVHIAHDCIIGDNVIFANNATLAGHVTVDDYVIIGGLSAVRQFVRIGKHAMIGGMAGIDSDIIPFAVAHNERANLAGINLVGLKRFGFDRDTIHNLINAYDKLFKEESNFEKRIESIRQEFSHDEKVMDIIDFLEKDTKTAICKPKYKNV